MESTILLAELLDESSDDSNFWNTLSSSSSSSASEIPTKVVRVENYFDVITKYTNLQFRQHFRLNTVVAQRIIDEYRSHSAREEHGGRKKVGPEGEIYIMLWFLANTETYRQISDRFDITRSSVKRILYRTIEWMVRESHNYIKWPTIVEQQHDQLQFQMLKGIPHIVGAIDGTHIKISPPQANKESFLNRKKYYSILLQGIVNVEKKFIDVYCGEPGSIHDARLFRKSTIFHHLNTDSSILVSEGVIIGDSAYAESNYMVPPFKDFGNLSAKQRKFNYLLSATRIGVEHAFGLLKCRFRRLKFFESPNISFISNCVLVACVLHNICLSENDLWDIEYLDDEGEAQPDTQMDQGNIANGARARLFQEIDLLGLLD